MAENTSDQEQGLTWVLGPEKRIFTHSKFWFRCMSLGAISFSLFSVFALADGETWPVAIFLTGAFFCFRYTLEFSGIVSVDGEGITLQRLWMRKQIAWEDAEKITPKKWENLLLRSKTGETILVDSQLNNFFELVGIISTNLPDLWRFDIKLFYYNLWVAALAGLGGLSICLLAISEMLQRQTSEELSTPLLILLFGLGTLFAFFQIPQAVSFDDRFMVLHYMGWRKQLQASGISEVFVVSNETYGIRSISVWVVTMEGKRINFANIEQGAFAFVDAVKDWAEAQKGK